MGTVAGAVLTGGASRRMGSTKALVPERGVPLAERAARALHDGGCDPVFLVGGEVDDLAGLGRPVVADLTPGSGPLGGVLSALAAASGAAVLVAACDLPRWRPPRLPGCSSPAVTWRSRRARDDTCCCAPRPRLATSSAGTSPPANDR
ncbi:MAG: NTP transferase domain-containing protein [Ilumatobacteraceae bacterium]